MERGAKVRERASQRYGRRKWIFLVRALESHSRGVTKKEPYLVCAVQRPLWLPHRGGERGRTRDYYQGEGGLWGGE
jgi:hypothetical protein